MKVTGLGKLALDIERNNARELAVLGMHSWGYSLETYPDPITMVIRVELFTHKLSETNTSWHCMVNWLLMHDYVNRCLLLAGLVDE